MPEGASNALKINKKKSKDSGARDKREKEKRKK